MINYIELKVVLNPYIPNNEIAVVWLSEIGFESFIDEDPILKAYIPESEYQDASTINALKKFNPKQVEVNFSALLIPAQNWNKVWEDGFEPVVIDDLSIVAPFHDLTVRKNRVIEIEPKMSFGTGHHQTTFLMCQAMKDLDIVNKKVLDMGAGTGILAINAEQLGANDVLAVDIETWSVENTRENAKRNGCSKVRVLQGDIDAVTELEFDIILANINRNVLVKHMPSYLELLKTKGKLLLSGFFTTDLIELENHGNVSGFERITSNEKENWACMLLEKR